MTVCFPALLPAGCNGGGGDGDADTDFSTEEIGTWDMDVLETPSDVPADTPVDIPSEDLAAEDPAADPLPDPEIDEDAVEDPADEDVAEDVLPEAEDADEVQDVTTEIPTDCLLLTGDMLDAYSWTLAFMSTGTNVAFDLSLANSNPAGEECGFSGFSFRGMTLKLASDSSLIVEYDSIEAVGTPPSTLAGGDEYTGEYTMRYSESTVSTCEQLVYATLIVDYLIDGLIPASLSVKTANVSHECIY
ncbi:MAG: hypothetical protein ABIJ56_11090 [Pseudomonadota bacterium]